MRSKGFTLIELLVVIAIIAILAAILFPVFLKAKQNAMQSACQNSMRQVGIAVDLYANDNGERMPFCQTWGQAWVGGLEVRSDGMFLPELVKKYTSSSKNSRGLFRCPAVTDNDSWWNGGWTLAKNGGVSYIWNHITFDPKNNRHISEKPISGRQRSDAVKISRAPILWDIPYWGQANARHNRGIVVVFADGHSHWVLCERGDTDWYYIHSNEGWAF